MRMVLNSIENSCKILKIHSPFYNFFHCLINNIYALRYLFIRSFLYNTNIRNS